MNAAKSIGLWVVRLFGFKRPPAKTRFQKYARRSERGLTTLALLYAALLCFPQVLFGYNISEKGVTVYSRTPLPAETAARVDEDLGLVGQSEVAQPGRHERVFVCNNPWLFRLFAPLSASSFAISWPVTDNVFIAQADVAKDLATSAAEKHNRRAFSGVLAHEITHGLIRRRLGLLRGVRLPNWVAEGYCDFVARESSFPEETGLHLLADGGDEPSPSFRYFAWRQMVRHLIDDEHYSFDELVLRAGDLAAVKAETIAGLKEQETR
jgi:hypothetical protein